MFSPKIDAVSASVSGVVKWKMPCGRASAAYAPVAELVRHRQHVVGPRRVVEHHVRMGGGHGVRAERAAALAGAGRAVHVAAREELGRGVAELRGEGAVAVEHDLLGLSVRDAVVAVGHRRHAVVVRKAVEAEEARLEPVPAARQVVAALHGLDSACTDSSLASLARFREASQCG